MTIFQQAILNVFLLLMSAVPLCAQQKIVIVAADGTGQYRKLQDALDDIPAGNLQKTTISIKPGIYKEVVVVDARKNFVTLMGEDAKNTIITFDNHAGTKLENGDTLNTWSCATFFVYGNDFHAENITFENTAGFTAGQAVGLRIEGNRASLKNCRIYRQSGYFVFKRKRCKALF